MDQRDQTLDALRGYAIITMILSGTIAFGDVLPAWMYHAQVPPPDHKFNPDLPGITWVDLVFPFFLFSMGAAIPLSMQKGFSWKKLLLRFASLAYFSLFFEHVKYFNFPQELGIGRYLISITGLASLFLLFGAKKIQWRLAGLLLSLLILVFAPYKEEKGFDLHHSDIIIMVLANMALLGGIIWWFTRTNNLYRLMVLPVLFGLITGRYLENSWNHILYQPHPLDWLINFNFFKYLFIIIPGTFAGEWLIEKAKKETVPSPAVQGSYLVSLLIIMLIGWNVYALYTRMLSANLFVSILVSSVILLWQFKLNTADQHSRRLVSAGIYLLLTGLCFEAFEGGIKKDNATFSYFFVTSGMAFLGLFALQQFRHTSAILSPVGRNPMIAYVLTALFTLPLLSITGLNRYYDNMTGSAWEGFLRGVLLTAIAALLTSYCTSRKWFWKT